MSTVNRLHYPNGVIYQDFDHTLERMKELHARQFDWWTLQPDADYPDLSERKQDHIDHHFMYTAGRGEADTYQDLKGPVVSGNHYLSKAKLDNLDARNNQVEGISDSTRRRGQNKINRLQRDVFNE